MSKKVQKVLAMTSLLVLCTAITPSLYAAPVAGNITGFQSINQIRCRNATTRQRVIVNPTVSGSWDCEQAGLTVNTGDRVTVDILVTAQGLIPDKPQAVSALGARNYVLLQWNQEVTATHYSVYRALQPDVALSNANKLTDIVEPLYIDSSVTPDVTYYYAITASNGTGESLPSDVITGMTNVAGLDHRTLVITCAHR